MDYILKHYASEYYDPEKAHQYYEEHKQLKGRRSTAKLDDEGKEIWAYTKESIKNKKKEELQAATDTKNVTLEQHRAEAKEARERISQRLKQLSAYLKSISTTGMSKEERAAVNEDKRAQREEARESAAAEREEISNNLKAVCEAARETYKKTKEDINANYEEIFDTEYEKILAEHEKTKGGSKQRDPRVEQALRDRGLIS